jgi:hypothetical protein
MGPTVCPRNLRVAGHHHQRLTIFERFLVEIERCLCVICIADTDIGPRGGSSFVPEQLGPVSLRRSL